MTVRLPAPGPIAGAPPNAGALPAGFAHPHASEEARLIAEAGLILRVQVGSGVHGTAIVGQETNNPLGCLCRSREPCSLVGTVVDSISRSLGAIA